MLKNLKPLKRSWMRSRQSMSDRFAFYDFLLEVYQFYSELRETQGAAKKLRSRILKMGRHSRLGREHPVYAIISATTRENTKTKSRWT